MTRRSISAWICFCVSGATPINAGAALQPLANAGGTITVTGRDAAETARRRSLVKSITPIPAFDEPVPRFADPVCFAVSGLPDAIIVDIANRMVDDALGAGLRTGGGRCVPNVFVMFVDDGRPEMERLRRHRPGVFGSSSLSDIRRIIREPGPVHEVIASAIRSRDGDPVQADGVAGMPVLKVSTASRAELPVRRDILTSVLLIDRQATVGLSATQIADYAAMRTLAVVRPGPIRGGQTILSLFGPDPRGAPTESTSFDRAYLKALYSGAGNRRGIVKIEQMARYVSQDGASPSGDGVRLDRSTRR